MAMKKTRPVNVVFDEIRGLSISQEEHEKLIRLVEELELVVGSCLECDTNFLKMKPDQRFCKDRCATRVRQRKFRVTRNGSVTANHG